MRELGVRNWAEASRTLAARPVEPCRVWPENWDALRLFLAMGTQWRRAGMAGLPLGLDYAVLPIVGGALDIAIDAPLLRRLRVLEDAMLEDALKRA